MIRSFRHKGLEKFFFYDDRSKIIPGHADRLARILDRLDASAGPDDMNLPGFKLHRLSGKEVQIPTSRVARISYEESTVLVNLTSGAVEQSAAHH